MALMIEHWKPIVGWETRYEISCIGTVRRLRTSKGTRAGIVIKPYLNGAGYWAVNLWKEAKQHKYSVHALVAAAFHGMRPARYDVNHIDSNRQNPRASNLEYLTRRDNLIHGYDRKQRETGVRAHNPVLTLHQVLAVFALREQLSCAEIADLFHVSRQVVSGIVFGRIWSWATGASGEHRPPRTGHGARIALHDEIRSIDPNMSSRKVARLFGVSHTQVLSARKSIIDRNARSA